MEMSSGLGLVMEISAASLETGLSLEGDIPENFTPRQRLLQSIVVGEGDILLPQVQIGGVQGIGLTLHKDVGVLIIDIGQCAPCCRNGKHGNDDENGHQLIAFLLFQSVFLRIFELPPIIIQLNQNCNRILRICIREKSRAWLPGMPDE